MNRAEALRTLGLSEGATAAEIKAAYRETAQIMHPDKFAGNKKLQARATEQFKNVQEAYALLTSGKGSARRTSATGGTSASRTAATPDADASGTADAGCASAREAEARLAGIAAARVQLVAQRDAAYDERRTGVIMVVLGGLAALIFGRKLGMFAMIAAVGATALVWGGLKAVAAQRSITALNRHLDRLAAERAKLESQLEDW